MQVKYKRQALRELARITDIYLEYSGPIAARRLIGNVEDCIMSLQKFPFIGHPEPLLTDRKRLYRAKSINKNYRMIYYTTQKTIWIVDFWDRRRDPAKLARRVK